MNDTIEFVKRSGMIPYNCHIEFIKILADNIVDVKPIDSINIIPYAMEPKGNPEFVKLFQEWYNRFENSKLLSQFIGYRSRLKQKHPDNYRTYHLTH